MCHDHQPSTLAAATSVALLGVLTQYIRAVTHVIGLVLVWVLTDKHLFIFNKYYYQLVIATYLVVATQQHLDILIIIATWINLDTATTHWVLVRTTTIVWFSVPLLGLCGVSRRCGRFGPRPHSMEHETNEVGAPAVTPGRATLAQTAPDILNKSFRISLTRVYATKLLTSCGF